MVRAQLRAGQMRDVDNLTEPEHDVLVHVDLVTSGTVDFQDGTISGTGDVYAANFYVSGEKLYTQAEVDALITTVSGALQLQIDELLAL